MSGWEVLGNLLGGGIDREGAFTEGQLHSAKTTEAIARAAMNRDKQAAIERARALNYNDPNVRMNDVIAGGLGADFASATQGRLRTQDFDNRETLASLLTTPQQKANASFAVQGKYEPLTPLGAGGVVDIRNPELGVTNTPLGASMVTENIAQAALANETARLREAERTNPAIANKSPAGYRADPANPGALTFTPGGPADPAVLKAGKAAAEPSEGERKDAALATRLENSLQELEAIKLRSPGASQKGWGEATAGMFGETAANAVRSADRQQAYAAQLDALDAILTLSTGAAYTTEQLKTLHISYFPQLNDEPETVAAKERKLQIQINLARERAGRAAPSISKSIPAPIVPVAESTTPTASYATEADAEAAEAAGALAKGTRVTINGVSGTWQ
jgi:hypothetical protein